MIPKGTIFKTCDGAVYFELARDHLVGNDIYGMVLLYKTPYYWQKLIYKFYLDSSKQLTKEEINQLNKLMVFSS